MNQSVFAVYAQDFPGSAESRYTIGEYPTENAALTAAAERVRADLQRLYHTDLTAKELFDLWLEKGEDVVIVPDDPIAPFSAIDFARLMALRITGETGRPLLMEVTCIDCLSTASGFTTSPKQWTFWVRAPATYAGATNLVRRTTEFLYREMSRAASSCEGSRYVLLNVAPREVTCDEMADALLKSAQKTVYTVREDGAFVE
jgi:hypothetical protein